MLGFGGLLHSFSLILHLSTFYKDQLIWWNLLNIRGDHTGKQAETMYQSDWEGRYGIIIQPHLIIPAGIAVTQTPRMARTVGVW